MPDKETINEFQRIYVEEFGESISREAAYDNFLKLTNLIRLLLKSKNCQGRGDLQPNASGFDQNSENGKM